VTIQHLKKGSDVTLWDHPNVANVIDFASVMVITRSIFETYLNLFETCIEPTSEDEFKYRHAVYELRGFLIRESPLLVDPDLEMSMIVEQKLEEVETIRERVRETAFFQKLNSDQQKNTLEGKLYPKRKFVEIAKAAGFGEQFIEKLYRYLSGYVHGDSLSIAQIADATNEQKRSYIDTNLQRVMIIISKVILDYANLFPQAKAVCDEHPSEMRLVNMMADVAREI
jgi:hypothetical protein